MAFLILRRTHYPSYELGQTFFSSFGYASTIKTGGRRIVLPDELPFVVRPSRRISKESSSRRIIWHNASSSTLTILETHNPDELQMFPQVRPDG